MSWLKPEKCCDLGTYGCDIPMPIKGRVRGIDHCVADIVAALNAANIETVASCCGHGGQAPVSILLADGRHLTMVDSPQLSTLDNERKK